MPDDNNQFTQPLIHPKDTIFLDPSSPAPPQPQSVPIPSTPAQPQPAPAPVVPVQPQPTTTGPVVPQPSKPFPDLTAQPQPPIPQQQSVPPQVPPERMAPPQQIPQTRPLNSSPSPSPSPSPNPSPTPQTQPPRPVERPASQPQIQPSPIPQATPVQAFPQDKVPGTTVPTSHPVTPGRMAPPTAKPMPQIPPTVAKPAQTTPVPEQPVATLASTTTPPSAKLPPLLWKETQNILMKIEHKLGGPVVSYFESGSMSNSDVKYFYSHLRDIGFRDKLFFIIVSGGGEGTSAYRIASLLKNYCKELTVVIPEIAASAATMLSLAGDSIIMTPLAYLTAVDTSSVHPLNPRDRDNYPVRVELEQVKRATEVLLKSKGDSADNTDIYKTIFNYIHPVAFGNMERASTLSEMLCRDILSLRNEPLPKEDADKLINKLNHEYPAHGYPITRQKAKTLGLKITDSDDELDNLLWKYLDISRVLTEPVRTDFTDSYYHNEAIINSIESVGRRLMLRESMERRLDPIIKGWTTLKDTYKRESVSEVEENGQKKIRVSSLEV